MFPIVGNLFWLVYLSVLKHILSMYPKLAKVHVFINTGSALDVYNNVGINTWWGTCQHFFQLCCIYFCRYTVICNWESDISKSMKSWDCFWIVTIVPWTILIDIFVNLNRTRIFKRQCRRTWKKFYPKQCPMIIESLICH